jgi:lipoprotein-anchoring transpeptidase ErfK/SrfK
MTDLVTRPDAGHEHGDATAGDAGNGETAAYAWAPAEPAPKKNRTALWISIPAAATVVALIAASLVLIAPGASVAGVPVGGLTPGAAADAIDARLAGTEVVVDGPEGSVTVTGADLGASVDAAAIADAAFAENPMWNPASWFPASVDATVDLDPVAATEALRAVAPGFFVDPVDAAVTFDPASASYVVTDAIPGEGIDVAAVQAALQSAFDSGTASTSVPGDVVSVDALATTDQAVATAATLNGMLDGVGFYVGDERTVPVDRAVAASWLTVAPSPEGGFAISADAAAIQPTIDGLAGAVNREAVNATVITNSAGAVLQEEAVGVVGRALDSTDGLAAQAADLLSQGQGAFPLTVSETPFTTTTLARTIEVNLSTQRTILYENGQVLYSWASSTGRPESPTTPGRFTIGWKTPMQDMGCFEGATYCTEDVPWVSYFNGDEAFHGAYWHNNFGQVMSHGCVNLPVQSARFLYDWAPQGVEVWVHY